MGQGPLGSLFPLCCCPLSLTGLSLVETVTRSRLLAGDWKGLCCASGATGVLGYHKACHREPLPEQSSLAPGHHLRDIACLPYLQSVLPPGPYELPQTFLTVLSREGPTTSPFEHLSWAWLHCSVPACSCGEPYSWPGLCPSAWRAPA